MQHFAFMCWRSVYYFVYFVLSVFHKVLVFNYQNHCLSAFFFHFIFINTFQQMIKSIYHLSHTTQGQERIEKSEETGEGLIHVSLSNIISVFHQHDVSNINMNSVNFLRPRYHFRSVFLFEEAHICLKMIRLSRCLLLFA